MGLTVSLSEVSVHRQAVSCSEPEVRQHTRESGWGGGKLLPTHGSKDAESWGEGVTEKIDAPFQDMPSGTHLLQPCLTCLELPPSHSN